MTEAPSIHAVNCKVNDCTWSSLGTSMIRLYGDLEDHLKDEHEYSDQEWREARERLEQA